MDTDAFVKLVKAMRATQKSFYRAEAGSADRTRFYHEAKSLERQVDRAIPEMEDKQMRLFDTKPEEPRRAYLPDRLALLEGLLAQLEWRLAYYGVEYITVCTWCGCRKETGHAPGCQIALALGRPTRDERKYPLAK